MKNIIILITIILISFGCKRYVQVIETKSNNTQLQNKLYVLENDTLRITYNFWAEKGLIAFEVYNKADKPLYIDWKKSSYINNKIKLNYWENEIVSKSYVTRYGSYYFFGDNVNRKASSFNLESSISSITKAERITFIPPKSKYYRSQFVIYPTKHFKFKSKKKFKKVPRNDNPKKETKIYELSFSKKHSPLIFRNFITFSFTEDFETEFYIDNEFHISKVTEMNRKHFEQVQRNEDGDYLYKRGNPHPIKISKFKNGNSFYIRIPKNRGGVSGGNRFLFQ